MTDEWFRVLISLCAVGCLIGAFILFLQAHLYSGPASPWTYFELVQNAARWVLRLSSSRQSSHPEANEQTVVIFGLRGSGKTRLWQHLTVAPGEWASPNSVRMTIPSAEMGIGRLNPAIVNAPNDPLTLEDRMRMFGRISVIDTPGSWASDPSKVAQLIATRNIIALIYCIDSVAGETTPRESASYFFEVLASEAFQRRRPAVCLAVSRLSHPDARRKNAVRDDFERETERSFRHHLENVASLRKAAVPLAYPRTFLGRLLYPLRRQWLQFQFERLQARRSKVYLISEGNFFRFTNLDCRDKLLAQEDNELQNASYIKSFLLKVAAKSRQH